MCRDVSKDDIIACIIGILCSFGIIVMVFIGGACYTMDHEWCIGNKYVWRSIFWIGMSTWVICCIIGATLERLRYCNQKCSSDMRERTWLLDDT